MSIPEDDPRPTGRKCPKCRQPAREADQRTEYVKDRPYVCDACPLWFTGTEAEFRRYRIVESVQAAERMTTSPRHTNGDERR